VQIERRATSLLDCYAEMLPIFYKDSNFLPKPSLFPFYPNFGPKTHKTEAQEGEKSRKTTKNALFLKKTQIFFAGFKNCRNFALAIRKRINIMTP
jgi:hypothetical protein